MITENLSTLKIHKLTQEQYERERDAGRIDPSALYLTPDEGNGGKSAYEYAKDAGYTGTEEEFAAKLAEKIPDKLPNPMALTINGNVYDGSQPVEINISGGGSGTTETVLSDNLFDKSTAILGKAFYHSSSGTQLIDASDRYYAYVELRGAGTYRTKVDVAIHSENYAQRVPLLKADKTWIRNITGTISDTGDTTAWDLEFTVTQDMIDEGAVYYPLTIHKNNIDTVMMVKDRDYPTEYIPYGYIEVQTDVDVSGKLDNILYGKTAVFLGDSICAGDIEGSEYDGYGWAGLIGEANSMTWKNYGRNGGTIAPLENVVAESRDLCSQVDLAKTDYPEADYVIFEGGSNDAYQLEEAGLGKISDDFATFDTSTFSGAMESLILKILTAFPNAQVGYIVAYKMGNHPYTSANIQRKYFDRAVEICQKWGIPVIDLWNGSFLNPALTYHAENFYTDKQHLTLDGFKRISPQIESWMRNLTTPGVVSGDGSVESAPADWNAAEGEPGHVLNRTHYKKFEPIIQNMEVAIAEDGMAEIMLDGAISFEIGVTYRVNWNGEEYLCGAHETDGSGFVGDAMLGGNDPFTLTCIPMDETLTTCMVVSMEANTTITLSVEKLVYEKIPVEYLPDSLRSYTAVPADGEISDSTAWSLSETADKAAQVLYNGGTVYIDCSENGSIHKCQLISHVLIFSDQGTMLTGIIIYARNIVSVSFAPGTWTPPTA